MARTFNRPYIAYLDNKKVTIRSFDIVNKIIKSELKKGDNLIFETDEETSRELRGRISNRVKLNLKIYNCLDADLLLQYVTCGRYEIQECEVKNTIYKCESCNWEGTNPIVMLLHNENWEHDYLYQCPECKMQLDVDM